MKLQFHRANCRWASNFKLMQLLGQFLSLTEQMASKGELASEEELIERSKLGDRNAFGELIERYQDMVYTLTCRTLGDSSRVQDVAQEAFIRSWRAIGRFKKRAKFSSWLYRITLNACFTELRRSKKLEDPLPPEELEVIKRPGTTGKSFESSIEKRDLVEQLIQGLPPIYRSIVVLHYLQGLDCREIAAVLERPVGTIKAYLHRARAQLRTDAEQLLQTRSRP